MQHFSLSNGLDIIVHCDPKIKNTVLSILYLTGSANEAQNKTGLAHFLEHMMFEGSRNYPNFDEQLHVMMAENNAFTAQDYTCYYTSFPTRHLKAILSIERDRMQYLNLRKRAINNQTNIILEEFKETSLNSPLADFWHHLQRLCFKNSYKWPVIGKSLAHIKRIDKDSLTSFYNSYYTPGNVVFSVISSGQELEIAKVISSEFKSNLVKKKRNRESIKIKEEHMTKGRKQILRTNIVISTFFLAKHIDDYVTKDYFLSDMLSDLLTNGESSLLYKDLVLNRRICTEIHSYTTDNLRCNLLIIEGKLVPGVCFEDVYAAIHKVFISLKTKPLSLKQFETLKNKAMTYWSFNNYNSMQLAQNMALFFAALGVININTFIANMYQSISKKDLELHAKNLLDITKYSILEYKPKV